MAAQAQASDATTALIARLLAEDNPYEQDAELDREDDSDDADYGRPAKRRKPKAGGKAAAKKAQRPSDTAATADGAAVVDPPEASGNAAADTEGAAYTGSGRRRRKDAGGARTVARGWSDEEDRLFQEALEQHGRDWAACAAHIGTRDTKSVTSHAQKWLIRLAIDGKPLPVKMAESGVGYTLSGKLLDPYSASAVAYGLKPGILARLYAEASPSLAGMTPVEKDGSGNLIAQLPSAAPAKPECRPKPKMQRQAKPQQEEAEPNTQWASVERTEYAKARPRRATPGPRSALGETTESIELVRCRDFVGPPGSGAPLAQPFHLEVQAQVALVIDFHAHLSSLEIIGLLGGRWDAANRRLQVVEAFPCRPACGTQSGTSVELDANDDVQTRMLMEEKGLRPVGWYHSHPVFETRPSQKDCENQRNYQALFRTEGGKDEPCVAAIFGPYDHALPDEKSSASWFVVQSRGGELTPFTLQYTTSSRATPDEVATGALVGLAASTRGTTGRVDLAEQWRPFTRLKNGKDAGCPLSRMDKLCGALRVHLPLGEGDKAAVDAWLEQLSVAVQDA